MAKDRGKREGGREKEGEKEEKEGRWKEGVEEWPERCRREFDRAESRIDLICEETSVDRRRRGERRKERLLALREKGREERVVSSTFPILHGDGETRSLPLV